MATDPIAHSFNIYIRVMMAGLLRCDLAVALYRTRADDSFARQAFHWTTCSGSARLSSTGGFDVSPSNGSLRHESLIGCRVTHAGNGRVSTSQALSSIAKTVCIAAL